MKATSQRAREARLFNTEHLPGTWDPPGGKVSHGHISGRNKAALAVQQLVPDDLEVGMTKAEKCIYFCCSSRHLGRQRGENGDVNSFQPQKKKPCIKSDENCISPSKKMVYPPQIHIHTHTYIWAEPNVQTVGQLPDTKEIKLTSMCRKLFNARPLHCKSGIRKMQKKKSL